MKIRSSLLFAVTVLGGGTAIAETDPNFLPPDFFKKPDGSYFFNPALEKPCPTTQNRSGFCPNEAADLPTGWVMARYKSRHAGGFDSGTASLLMVYVPPGAPVNGVPDNTHRWLNFALPTDPTTIDPETNQPLDSLPTPRNPIPTDYSSGGPRTFTMVSATVVEGQPTTVHFNKFYRGGNNDAHTPDSYPNSVSGCYSCHPNGLRAISPLGFHVDAKEAANPNLMLDKSAWQAVQKINKAMDDVAGGAVVNWDQGFVPKVSYPTKRYGPSDSPGRTPEFIQSCAKGPNMPTSYRITDIFGRAPGRKNIYTMDPDAVIDSQKIIDAMDCESCHNHETRGALTQGTSADQINFKILVDQSMPAGYLTNPYSRTPSVPYKNKLDVNHRIALANCLRAEFERQ